MAQKTIVRLVDDLDETVLENGNGQTVRFGLDGRHYEIDLTDEHAEQLRGALSRYVQAARKTGGATQRGARAKAASSKPEYSAVAVREWAKANKIDVPARGRLPRSVVDQFHAAGN